MEGRRKKGWRKGGARKGERRKEGRKEGREEGRREDERDKGRREGRKETEREGGEELKPKVKGESVKLGDRVMKERVSSRKIVEGRRPSGSRVVFVWVVVK